MRLINGLRIKVESLEPYGSYIAKDNTLEDGGLDFEALNYLEPSENLPKIPSALFRKVIKFFYDYASKHLEVHARIVYSPKLKLFKCFVPTQLIAGASVETFDYTNSIDLETGERVSLPHRDFITLWQWHVHPFALPDPSEIDDNGFPGQQGTGELDRPGGYGVASTWRVENGKAVMTLRCTVVVNDGFTKKNKRLSIPTSAVVEGVEDGESILIYNASYSELAHSVVSRYVPQVITQSSTQNLPPLPARYWDWNTGTTNYLNLDTIVQQYSLEEVLGSLTLKYSKAEVKAALNKVEE